MFLLWSNFVFATPILTTANTACKSLSAGPLPRFSNFAPLSPAGRIVRPNPIRATKLGRVRDRRSPILEMERTERNPGRFTFLNASSPVEIRRHPRHWLVRINPPRKPRASRPVRTTLQGFIPTELSPCTEETRCSRSTPKGRTIRGALAGDSRRTADRRSLAIRK